MISARQFIQENYEKHSSNGQLRKNYFYNLTNGIDKHFVVDLSRVFVELLEPKEVLREMLQLISYLIAH